MIVALGLRLNRGWFARLWSRLVNHAGIHFRTWEPYKPDADPFFASELSQFSPPRFGSVSVPTTLLRVFSSRLIFRPLIFSTMRLSHTPMPSFTLVLTSERVIIPGRSSVLRFEAPVTRRPPRGATQDLMVWFLVPVAEMKTNSVGL